MSDPTGDTEALRAEAPPAETPPPFDESIVQMVASKIFVDWLRNRQQLLVPLTLDLRKLETRAADRLVQAMVAAVEADGVVEPSDRERLEAALIQLHASDEQRRAVAHLQNERKPLRDVLADVRDVQTAAMVYAASLLVLDRRKRVNRYYMRYLAERLQLPTELTRTLEQRFVSAA